MMKVKYQNMYIMSGGDHDVIEIKYQNMYIMSAGDHDVD